MEKREFKELLLEKMVKLEEKKKKEEEERANRERELVTSQWKRKEEAKAAFAKAAAEKSALEYEARAKQMRQMRKSRNKHSKVSEKLCHNYATNISNDPHFPRWFLLLYRCLFSFIGTMRRGVTFATLFSSPLLKSLIISVVFRKKYRKKTNGIETKLSAVPLQIELRWLVIILYN
jgi:hypothetical protein